MIIANPIYDTAFKHLMENKRIARFFIGTLIGEQIDDIALMPQEYVFHKRYRPKKKKKETVDEDVNEKVEVFSVIRYDFVATIRTDSGEHKKILIEIQKSRKPTDLIRFRTYLGEQYKRVDVVDVATKKIEKSLPIICILLLGFPIPQIDVMAIKVCRHYVDIISKKLIKQKSELIEALTHDGYFVQIPHIKGKPRSILEEMLSVFEQKLFIDDKNITKEYDYSVANEIIREMLDTLRYVASDPKQRRAMEEEWWDEQDEKAYEEMRQELEAKAKELDAERKKSEAAQAEMKAAQAEKQAQMKNTVINCHHEGLSIDTIMNITKLTKQQIIEILQQAGLV